MTEDIKLKETPSTPERASNAERKFLNEKGSSEENLVSSIRIFLEYLRGLEAFDFKGSCVTVFGSARFREDHEYYKLAREVGRKLAESGFVVMTGGGPGIMEAANRGAKEGGGLSLGCNIVLPREQHPNPYLDKYIEFDHFFVRKTMLIKYSCAFIVMPGGLGTMDEVFETLTLIQTNKISRFPVVAMGTSFWGELLDFVTKSMLAEKTISEEDMKLLFVTDSVDEMVDIIKSKSCHPLPQNE